MCGTGGVGTSWVRASGVSASGVRASGGCVLVLVEDVLDLSLDLVHHS
jgi:hypothetical protein